MQIIPLSSCQMINEQPFPIAAKNTKRCNHIDCKVKLALTDYDCKCGKRFCGKHRHFETHSCTFDYRKAAETKLTDQLVKCNGEKLVERV